MRRLVCSFFLLSVMFLAATSVGAQVLSLSDVYVHYKFDDTSGTAFVDSSSNANNATFYSVPTYQELSTVDAYDTYYPFGAFGNATILGPTTILGANKEVMIDVPTASHLPGVDDSFAVSFWLSVADWGGSDGLVGSYNYNGLQWTLGMQGRTEVDGFVFGTNSAGETGTSTFVANCVAASLVNETFNHFVVQFDGDAGISAVYINGTSVTNTFDPASTVSDFFSNEREGITLGGRVLDARTYTPIDTNTFLDDFAIVSGVADANDISNLYGSGASSLGNRRLLHLAMDNTSGSVVTDSSSYANHGTLIANDPAATSAVHDVSSTSRAGQIDGAVELANACNQYAVMDENGVNSMPVTGEAFTVCFWLKPDENNGWDYDGVISSWSNDDLGISISMMSVDTGTIGVRCTDGTYTGSSSMYGVYVGEGKLDLSTDEFHHFAVTVDENGDVTGMYIDGDYVDKVYNNANGVTVPESSYMGLREHPSNPAANYPLCAYLDDYAVVKGELTELQIELAMSRGVVALYTESPQIPGDANSDGKVDGSDVTILANHWQEGVGSPDPTNITWAMGDFNGDGQIDGSDVTILANHWQEGVTSATASVPEPGTLILMLCGALSFCVLHRRK